MRLSFTTTQLNYTIQPISDLLEVSLESLNSPFSHCLAPPAVAHHTGCPLSLGRAPDIHLLHIVMMYVGKYRVCVLGGNKPRTQAHLKYRRCVLGGNKPHTQAHLKYRRCVLGGNKPRTQAHLKYRLCVLGGNKPHTQAHLKYRLCVLGGNKPRTQAHLIFSCGPQEIGYEARREWIRVGIMLLSSAHRSDHVCHSYCHTTH